jgi:hypothetical protein
MIRRVFGPKFMPYLLLAGGTAATIAANYAHAEENIGAKALSAAVPALLFVAFHVAARDGRWWIRVTTGAVAVLCFAISYDHIYSLARSYGESELSAHLYPLAIDGAMIVATFVLSRSADKAAVGASAVLSVPATRPEPVRKAVPAPAPVLSEDKPEDKPRTNGFVRPMPPVRPRTEPKDNSARLSAATRIAAELGGKLCREKLVAALKAEGYKISTNEAATLTRKLKAARS